MMWRIRLLLASFSLYMTAIAQQQNDAKLLAAFNQLYNTPFPELVLDDTSGQLFSTAAFMGKTIYIDYWFTACPPCIKEIPYAKALQQYFAEDTNIVFLNICIENVERKDVWKQMVKDKQIGGIHLFYARNRPQKINLLRQYGVHDFPTYTIVNADHKIIGHNAPRPSDNYLVQWVLQKAKEKISLAEAYKQTSSPAYSVFINQNRQRIDGLRVPQ